MRITLLLLFLISTACARQGACLPAKPMPAAALDDGTEITRIVLGSCFRPLRSASVFERIAVQEPEPYRLGDAWLEANHGLIDIDQDAGEVALRVIDEHNRPVIERVIAIDQLR